MQPRVRGGHCENNSSHDTVFHLLIFLYITCYSIFNVCFQVMSECYSEMLTTGHFVNKALMKIDSKNGRVI